MDQGPLNLETLESLREYADPDDPDFLRDLIRSYLSDGESHLAGIRAAQGAGDAAGLARLAHTLKGSSLNVGADGFSALMHAIDREARLGKLPDGERLRAADAEFMRVKAAFAPYLA